LAGQEKAAGRLMSAIGLMSGTSMDGIDIAFMETDGEAVVRRGPAGFERYEAAFRREIEASLDDARAISARQERPGRLAAVEAAITRRHAEAVRRFLDAHGIEASAVDVIGFHGQTVLHRPERALTVQLGDGAALARDTRIPVVSDMRANDMVHGGQGAPLVPAYHAALAAGLPEVLTGGRPVAFVNIGGISNVTLIEPGRDPVAFDTGPGNALIDQWVQSHAGIDFDDGGAIASEGAVVQAVVGRYLSNPYFARQAPKSLDRNDFTLAEAEGLELSDGARTLARVTAEAILKAVDVTGRIPGLWIVCGGGRRNRAVMADLAEGAARTGGRVIAAEEAGFDGDAMEAEAWAYLAVRSLKGLPLTWPTTTGCREPVTGGTLARPARVDDGV
jgi:anhydro-N-acetylmuramic acid kinase